MEQTDKNVFRGYPEIVNMKNFGFPVLGTVNEVQDLSIRFRVVNERTSQLWARAVLLQLLGWPLKPSAVCSGVARAALSKHVVFPGQNRAAPIEHSASLGQTRSALVEYSAFLGYARSAISSQLLLWRELERPFRAICGYGPGSNS